MTDRTRVEEIIADRLMDLARIHALLGDGDEAIDCLVRAIDDGHHWHPWPGVNIEFRALWSDPRYQAVVAKVKGH